MLAGDLVVERGRQRLLGWPVTGGLPRGLGRLPDLGPPCNCDDLGTDDGGLRVDAAEPGHVAIVRHTSQRGPTEIDTHHGPQLAVGPPQGPFAKVRGCGEVAGTPAALDGGRVAYLARPSGCLDEEAIVVRDAAGALERVVTVPPDDRSMRRLELHGDFLAYAVDYVFSPAPVVVVDLRTGARVTELPPREWYWTLGDDGTIYARTEPERSRGICPPGVLRRYPPGDVTGTPIAPACPFGLLDVVDGDVRFTQRAPDGRFVFRTGAGRTLATTADLVYDGDAAHLIGDDPDCRSRSARLIDLAAAPVAPAGPRQCPFAFSLPRRARLGQRIPIRLRCPAGCHATVTVREEGSYGPPFPETRSLRMVGNRTIHLRVTAARVRHGRMRVALRPGDPVGNRRFVRDVRVVP